MNPKKVLNNNGTGPAVPDPTFKKQREESASAADRVVIRHDIALNLAAFRAAPDGFSPRPTDDASELQLSKRPMVSVIIPNFNGQRFLPALMASLGRQTFSDFEVVVVDDGSSDSSVSWIEEQYPDARVIINRRNLGFVKSCNIGAGAARGRILILLNSDTEPEQEWLAELVRAVCHNPQAGMFASKVLLFDRPGDLHTTGDMMGRNGIPVNRGVWERDLGQYDDQRVIFGASGCAVAYRREVWDALGGFDEDFWMYMEDVDFAFRAQLVGVEAVFVPRARVLHRLTATAGGTLASFYVGRNTLWMLGKNMPRSLLIANSGQIIAAQLYIAADAMHNIRGAEARARLKGQLVGVLTLYKALSKRRIVQDRRTASDNEIGKRLYG